MFVEWIVQGQREASDAASQTSVTNWSVTVDQLYREYHTALIQYCRLRLGRSGTVEDAKQIVQEAFCRLSAVPDPQAIGAPRAYLYRAVSNTARNWQRHDACRAVVFHPDIGGVTAAELVSDEPSPERVVQARQDLAVLNEALESLTPRCRAVFAEVKFRGLSYEEAAQALGMSKSAVKKHLKKAMKHLFTALDAVDQPARPRPANKPSR